MYPVGKQSINTINKKMIDKIFGDTKLFALRIKQSAISKRYFLRLHIHNITLGTLKAKANLNIFADMYKDLLQRMEHSYESRYATMSYREILESLSIAIFANGPLEEQEEELRRSKGLSFYDPRFNPYSFFCYKTPENVVVILFINGDSNRLNLPTYTGFEVPYETFTGVFEELIKYATDNDLLE